MRYIYRAALIVTVFTFLLGFASQVSAQTPTNTATATSTNTATATATATPTPSPTATATGRNPDTTAYMNGTTASATPGVFNVGFRPNYIYICNDDGTDAIYFNWVGPGPAASTNATANIKVLKSTCLGPLPMPTEAKNSQFLVWLVAAANTPAYRFYAWR